MIRWSDRGATIALLGLLVTAGDAQAIPAFARKVWPLAPIEIGTEMGVLPGQAELRKVFLTVATSSVEFETITFFLAWAIGRRTWAERPSERSP